MLNSHPLLNFVRTRLHKVSNKTFFLCLLVVAIKLTLFVLFPNPMFFMGDSGSYLYTAETGWIPPDRSFVYGFVIGAILKIRHSLNDVIFFQTLLSTLSCFCLAYILIHYLKCSRKTASLLTFFFALEPNQLIYERFIMTETLSGFAFSCFLVCSFALLQSRKLFLGLALALMSVLCISLRISYLPAVILGSLFLFVRVFGIRWPMVLRTLLCGLALFCSIEGYKLLNGRLSAKSPALLYADGFFLVSTISPILTPDIFCEEGVSPEITNLWKPSPLSWYSRAREMWNPNIGLVAILKRYSSSPEEANHLAKRLAIRCLLKKPIDFLKLAIHSYGTYLDRKLYLKSLHVQFAGPYRGPEDERFLSKLISNYNYIPIQGRTNSGLVDYYSYCLPWFLLILVFPIIGSVLLVFKKFRSDINLFLMTSYNLSALVITYGDADFRYLHPFPTFVLLWLGWVTKQVTVNSSLRQSFQRFIHISF